MPHLEGVHNTQNQLSPYSITYSHHIINSYSFNMTTITMHAYPHLNSLILFFIFLTHSTSPSTCTLDSFVYAACSQLKYTPGTPYSSIVNSLLSSTINSASVSTFNNFKAPLPGSGAGAGAVSGLFQCRGDLAASDCRECVASAAGRLVASCGGAAGGAVQLDGCYVRYDNESFVGEEDKAVVYHGCGMSIEGGDADVAERRDDVAADLAAGVGQFFRVAGAGNVHGVAQCTQDLSAGECQDCLAEAIQRLRSGCGPSSPWGDMFLGKCYARYSERAYTPKNENADEVEKTLAIFIGLVAAVALLIVFLSFLSRLFGKKAGK